MCVQSLGWEDSLEEGMATHSGNLTQRITWTEERGELKYIGSQRVRHSWSDLPCMHWDNITLHLSLSHLYFNVIKI